MDGALASTPQTEPQMRRRYRRILRFAARHLANTWWFEIALPKIGLAGVAERTRTRRMRSIARQFHLLAVDLGGLMIKVGQFLSTRLDVLPPEITKELEGLQDEVPPVPFPQIRALAESELGIRLERAFEWIDEQPVAAASLGQVHRARLVPSADSDIVDVVIKVQRPGIGDVIDVDLRALRKVAGWLSRIRLVSSRADTHALIEEFATTSLEEIDYLNEGANAERFALAFADNPRVRVPEVVWERSGRRVLTQADVTAIKITDLEGLRAAGVDPNEVANEFAAVMFDQLFLQGFFHADPHPGNVFVTPSGTDWHLTFIDFGMMGTVPTSLGRALRATLIAAAARDGAGMVEGIKGIGVLLPSADTAELERAMTQLFARFGGMGFAELAQVDPREFRAFATEFGDIVRALPFQFPENFLLVLRALSLTSGVCSSLNPQFNIWNAVEPYSAKLIRAEGGNVVQAFASDALATAGVLARLPKRIDALVTRFEQGAVSVRTPQLDRRVAGLDRSVRRIVSAVLFATLFLGGLIVFARSEPMGWTLLGLSALPMLHALFAGIVARRGPLP